MVTLGTLIPLPKRNLCAVDEGGNDKKPRCGLLKLNGSKLTCHQEDCKESHSALCLENVKPTSNQTTKEINKDLS